MRRRLITVLAFAVVAAFCASMLAYRAISAHAEPVKASVSTVLVATRDLSMGALIGEQDVRAVAWQGAVTGSWIQEREDIVGRGVVSLINKGEPFSSNRLASKGAGAGLAAVIPDGMRAVAVRVDEVVGVSGFVVQGMRVDVLSSGTPPGQTTTGTVTRTILQNIEVLSAGQNFDRDGQSKPATVQVVNLLVTPEQAESLALASSETKIQLVLRNPGDVRMVTTTGTSTSRLLGVAPVSVPQARVAASAPRPRPAVIAPVPAKPIPERPTVVEVIHGSKKISTEVRKEMDQVEKQ